jgi:AI-2 transport protein TqsA
MARPAPSLNQLQRFTMSTLLVAVALLLLIYGRGFLVPIVLACLLTGLLTNAIIRLEKHSFPTWLATTVSIAIGIVVLVIVGFVLQSQTGALEQAAPRYNQRIQSIVADLAAWGGTDFVARIETAVAKFDFGNLAAGLANSVSGVFGDISMVLLYTAFLLGERGTLKAKLGYLVTNKVDYDDLNRVLSTVGQGIRRYLSIKTVVSSGTGVLSFLVLKFYGADFAELLGLLAFVLNFIPVIGSAIAVVVPVILALMQFDTINPALQIALLLACIQFLIGNVVEPKMMGRTLNLSPFVIIVSLTFWTTVWGLVGAFLSVPITAAAVILCRNIQPLRWFAILLSADGIPEASDEPAEPKLKFSWPFNKTATESEEFKALKAELEVMKAVKAKVVKSRETPPKKPAKRRAPVSKTRKTQK